MSKEVAKVISLKQAVENITTQFPEESKTIQAAIRKDIVALGTDEVFTLRDSEGSIKAFKRALTLSAADGTLIQPVPGGPYVVSAQGYTVWAEEAGASVIFPRDVNVDGNPMPNLTPIRDPQNRRILAVYARAVAFRYSSKGIPQVVDRCTIFDTPSYRLIDLLGKAKKYPQAFRLLPSRMETPKDPGTWADYPFDESTTLWVNTSHEEALAWFSQILNREKKAIDFAQTFAARNALKHLSGLQRAPGPVWTIPVLCWRPTGQNIVKWDAAQYEDLQKRVGNLSISNGADFESDRKLQIECKTGTERVSDEQGFEELERNEDPEDQPAVDVGQPHEPTKELSPDEEKIMANYRETKALFPDEFNEACSALRVDPLGDHGPATASSVIAKINSIMDSR